MNTTVNHPTLQGLAPKSSRARAVMIGVGLLVGLILIVFVYRGTFALYEQKRALDYLKRGSEWLSQGYFEDAKFELEVAERLGAPSPKTDLLLAKVNSALGNMTAAEADYRRAVELEPTVPENHFGLARALSMLGRRQEAIDELEAALDLKPGYIAARFLLARVFDKENRIKEAAKHYQVLAGQDMSKKQLAEIHVAMAKLLIKEKRKPRAQHLLQTAWFMDRKNEEAWRLLMALGRGKGHEDDVIGTTESTDTISSKITSPVRNEKLNDDVIEIKGTAVARWGAVVQVEVTNDGGHTWHQAKPLNGTFDRWVLNLRFTESDGRRFVLYSRATGSAGLPERPGPGVTIFVDNSGPAVVRQVEPVKPNLPHGWYVTPPVIDLATLEGDSLVFYRWDQGDYRVNTAALKAPVGIHTLSYFTRDRAGNEGPVERLTIKVKIAEAAG